VVIRLALGALVVTGCNVPAVDYLVADAGLPSTTFRQGLDGYNGTQDTFIDMAQSSTNFGDAINLRWTLENNVHTLLRFDGIMDRIPPNATIRDALLEIYVINAGSPSGMLYEITGNWTESTTYSTFGATPGVQAGEDRTSMQIGIISGAAMGAASFHVGASISRWKQNPTLNKGWVFIPNDINRVDIASSENPTQLYRPALTIVYTE
jgi:hypothetical protein